MRFMVCVKATKQSEAGEMPKEDMFAAMAKFNEELVKAGVMLDGAGLKPSSQAKRVRFSGDKRTVIDGPFPETKELISGYWIWETRSLEEAIEWAKRVPFQDGEIDVRPFFEMGDFEMSDEMKARQEKLAADLEKSKGARA